MATKKEKTDFFRRIEELQIMAGGLADELVELHRENNEDEGAALESLNTAVDSIDDVASNLSAAGWEPPSKGS